MRPAWSSTGLGLGGLEESAEVGHSDGVGPLAGRIGNSLRPQPTARAPVLDGRDGAVGEVGSLSDGERFHESVLVVEDLDRHAAEFLVVHGDSRVDLAELQRSLVAERRRDELG